MYFYLIPEKTLNYNHKKTILNYSGDGERPGEEKQKNNIQYVSENLSEYGFSLSFFIFV